MHVENTLSYIFWIGNCLKAIGNILGGIFKTTKLHLISMLINVED